jgi:hypothetical protein
MGSQWNNRCGEPACDQEEAVDWILPQVFAIHPHLQILTKMQLWDSDYSMRIVWFNCERDIWCNGNGFILSRIFFKDDMTVFW